MFFNERQWKTWWFGSSLSSDVIGWLLLVLPARFYQVCRNVAASAPLLHFADTESIYLGVKKKIRTKKMKDKVSKKKDSFPGKGQ